MQAGREIKYQAFDTVDGILADVKEIDFEIGVALLYDEVSEWYRTIGEHGAVLRQFTGLHDKNGKEIYEGDWLKDTESFDEVYFYCVVWSKSNCCFYFKDVFGTEHFGGEDLYLNQVEVIGNVFENPELLEVSA